MTLPTGAIRIMDLARICKKIEFKLSMEQLLALGRILMHYLPNMGLNNIDDKAIFYLLYKFSEKARSKAFTTKSVVKISVDIATAHALTDMFANLDLEGYPYEYMVEQFIVNEIYRQTV